MPPKPNEILLAVESATGVPVDHMLADNRLAKTSIARYLAMRLYHDTHPWSSNQDAALAVGKKDPGTGRHGLMRAAYLLENDAEFQQAHRVATEALKLAPAI